VAEVENLGMEISANETVDPGATSFTPQLQRLQDAGVENVAVFATAEVIGILRDAAAIGYEPRWTGAIWGYDFVSAAAQQAAQGTTSLMPHSGADVDAAAEWQSLAEEQGVAITFGNTSVNWYGYGLLLEEALKAAGENPTRESLLEGLESMNDYDNGILPPVTYGPDDHIASTASFALQCCDDNLVWQTMGPAQEEFEAGFGE
jgi:ABC-type branched-subunit amino acid transport system substrate-binding protein